MSRVVNIAGNPRENRVQKGAYPKGKVAPGGKLVQLLRECPNLHCDISAGSSHNALLRDPDFGREFLLEFQDRVLFGQGFFDGKHQELPDGMGLPTEVLQKIYFQNALRRVPDHPGQKRSEDSR